MPYMKMPLAPAGLPELSKINGETHILTAMAVFAKRKTSNGRNIEGATKTYNQTQLTGLLAFMRMRDKEPYLKNLTSDVIAAYIEQRQHMRYEPIREHRRLHPTCEEKTKQPHPLFCGVSDHWTIGWSPKPNAGPNVGRAEQITLSSFCRWLDDNTKWTAPSFKHLKRIKERHTRNHLSAEQTKRVLAAAKNTKNAGRDWPLTLLAFSTGLRLNEITSLEIGHVHFATGIIEVGAEGAKNKKDRVVPLFPELAEALQRYIHTFRRGALLHDKLWITQTGDDLTREGLRGLGRTLAAISGVPFSWHLARHTYAHTMLEVGSDVLSLRLALGHENLNETMRYAKGLSASQLAKLPSVAARYLETDETQGSEGTSHKGKKRTTKKPHDAPKRQKGRLSLAI